VSLTIFYVTQSYLERVVSAPTAITLRVAAFSDEIAFSILSTNSLNALSSSRFSYLPTLARNSNCSCPKNCSVER